MIYMYIYIMSPGDTPEGPFTPRPTTLPFDDAELSGIARGCSLRSVPGVAPLVALATE